MVAEAVPLPSAYAHLREVAEVVGVEFRKELQKTTGERVSHSPDVVDAIYGLLHRGVIEVGPGISRA